MLKCLGSAEVIIPRRTSAALTAHDNGEIMFLLLKNKELGQYVKHVVMRVFKNKQKIH